jgi:hypothetical protein
MLTKLAGWLVKVPHYAILGAVFVSIYGPMEIDVLATTPLAKYSRFIQGAVTLAFAILALAKQINSGGGGSPAGFSRKEAPTDPARKDPPVAKDPPATSRILWAVPLFAAFLMVFSCKTEQAIFTDVQVACQAEALATSVIPPGTPVALVAADVELACDLTLAVDTDVQAVVAAYEAAQAEAGVSATVYVPSPLAQKKRGALASHNAANDGGAK